MAEKIYVGANSKNIFNGKRTTSGTHIGVTYSYDKENQEYTLNGTSTNVGDLLLESGIPIDWEVGEYYTVTIIQTGGTAVIGDGEGITYSFSIFSMNNTKYIRDGNLSAMEFPGTRLFTAKAFAEVGGAGYKFYLQLWRVGTVFDNYKFKVQIEKGSQATDYVPYFRNVAKEAKKIYFSKNGIARLAEKAYTSVNGIAKLVYVGKDPRIVPETSIILMHLDGNNINEITGNNSGMPSISLYLDPKFGTKSGRASFTIGNYTDIPTYSELVNGTSDLTVSFWAYLQNTTGKQIFELKHMTSNNKCIYIAQINKNSLNVGTINSSNTYVTTDLGITDVVVNEWMHFAIVIKAGVLYIFYNGKKVFTQQLYGTGTIPARLVFGNTDSAVMRVDEILVCKEALYTDDFTPLDKPYVVE